MGRNDLHRIASAEKLPWVTLMTEWAMDRLQDSFFSAFSGDDDAMEKCSRCTTNLTHGVAVAWGSGLWMYYTQNDFLVIQKKRYSKTLGERYYRTPFMHDM